MYSININIDTETFNSIEHYFWCIYEQKDGLLFNCGHGWSKSIQEAALDAYKYYSKCVKSPTS